MRGLTCKDNWEETAVEDFNILSGPGGTEEKQSQ
jgi:hypothetical protein